MSEFEKWYESWQGWHEDNYKMNKMSYEAGQQSKQAEIDEYKEVAESIEDAYLREKSKVDELRKRIEQAMELLEYNEYTDSALQALDILKGTTNEQ